METSKKLFKFVNKNLVWFTCIFFSLLFLFYLYFDNTPPHWDSGRHIYNFEQYKDFFRNIVGVNGTSIGVRVDAIYVFFLKYFYYPPLQYWLSLPFYYLFGKNLTALLLTNLIWINLLIVVLFKFGKLLQLPKTSQLFWVIFLFASPMIIGQYREYQLDFPNFVVTVGVWYLLERINKNFTSKNIYLTSFLIGLAPLVKWQFVVHSLPLILIYLIKWLVDTFNKKLSWEKLLKYVYLQILSLATFSGFWYVVNLKNLEFDLVKNANKQGIIEGDPQGFSIASFNYILSSLTTNYLTLALILVIILVLVAFSWAIWQKPKLWKTLLTDSNSHLVYIALVFLSVVFIYHMLQGNKDYRYLIVLMLPISFLLVWLFNTIAFEKKNLSRLILGFLVVAFVYLNFCLYYPFYPSTAPGSYSLDEKATIPIVYFTQNGYINTAPKQQNWAVYSALAKAKDYSQIYKNDSCIKVSEFAKKATLTLDNDINLLHTSYGTYWGMSELYNLTLSDESNSCFVVLSRQTKLNQIKLPEKYLEKYQVIDSFEDWQNLNILLLAKKI